MAWRRQRSSGAREQRERGRPTAWALASRHRLRSLSSLSATEAQALELKRVDLWWHGHRVIISRVGDDVRIFADDLREWTDPFAPLAVAASELTAREFVLEGFVCVTNETGRPSFDALRSWVAGSRTGHLVFMALELRACPTHSLTTLLKTHPSPLLVASPPLEGSIHRVLESVRELGLPGVIAHTEHQSFAVSASAEPVPIDRSLSMAPKVTNPTKVLYPREGLTKADVHAYYADIAPLLLEAMRQRPIVAQRWPDGIAAFTWYQHRVPPRAPDYLKVANIDDDRRLLIDNRDALLWMVNQAALTFHGWASRMGSLDEPDWAVIDLDPGTATTWPQVIEIAHAVRALLELLDAPSVVKTSGQKGLHVLVPLAPGQPIVDAQAFADGVSRMVARLKPDLVSLEAETGPRRGRLFLDALQNYRGKSLVLPYSLRAVDGAPASTPIEWSEVTPSLDPRAFSLRTLRSRLDRVGNLFAPALRGSFRLAPALAKLRGE